MLVLIDAKTLEIVGFGENISASPSEKVIDVPEGFDASWVRTKIVRQVNGKTVVVDSSVIPRGDFMPPLPPIPLQSRQ
jgi:hypothetical protein